MPDRRIGARCANWSMRAIRACGPVPDSGRAAMLRLAESDPALAAAVRRLAPWPRADRRCAKRRPQAGIAPEWLEARLPPRASQARRRPRCSTARRSTSGSTRSRPTPHCWNCRSRPRNCRYPLACACLQGTPVEQWDAYRERRRSRCRTAAASWRAWRLRRVRARQSSTCAPGQAARRWRWRQRWRTAERWSPAIPTVAGLRGLAPRAQRAGAAVAETVLLDPGKELKALALDRPRWRQGRCGAGRCALFRHRHLAAQSRGALAAERSAAGALHAGCRRNCSKWARRWSSLAGG